MQVRRLSACETMGSATTICSDKTGTLTLNQMTVVEAYVGIKKMSPPEDYSQLQTEVSSLLHQGIAMNTTGSVFSSKDGKTTEVSGSPTEKAILQWAVKSGMKFDNVRSECTVLQVSPFNSTKKRGGVALRRDKMKEEPARDGETEPMAENSNLEVRVDAIVLNLSENCRQPNQSRQLARLRTLYCHKIIGSALNIWKDLPIYELE
ncbi:hypothetical protein POM88_027105 [Heracleum sosnowskyi]|uniref:Uncharacterized protein n=1 Tax=Heracleum sosnowskyi TaxID=360622 RepID=A0AAD8I7A4_9APIA|nr:hypothetical protein POM88_027105 [Heracleum sosnowskyi]